jgi:tetraprenyl-beta-curcumene synthase
MSATMQLSDRRAHARTAIGGDHQPRPTATRGDESATTALAFSQVVFRHLVHISPLVNRELAQWRARAAEICDDTLRRTAQQTLSKRGNIEGAALFAVLAPARHRHAAVRALVSFQTAYNYLDGLSELDGGGQLTDTRRLHEGLVRALQGDGTRCGDGHDDGYLQAITNACSQALAELPSYSCFALSAQRAAARIVEFQTLNLGESQGGHTALQEWALQATPPGSRAAWWETALSGGSSLSVHALVAASANPGLESSDAHQIERVYFPWIGALHSLLDSLVDRREDREAGLTCFLDYYDSAQAAADRLASLLQTGLDVAAPLPDARSHQVIATAMCSYYLSAPQCHTDEAAAVRRALTEVLGRPLRTATLMFRFKRRLHAVTDRSYS